MKNFKMTDLTKNTISETVRDRAKRTKILDHMSEITKIFKNSKFYETFQNGRFDQKCYLGNGER